MLPYAAEGERPRAMAWLFCLFAAAAADSLQNLQEADGEEDPDQYLAEAELEGVIEAGEGMMSELQAEMLRERREAEVGRQGGEQQLGVRGMHTPCPALRRR